MTTPAQTLSTRIDRISTASDRKIVPGLKRLQYLHSVIAFIFLGNATDESLGGIRMMGRAKRIQRGGRQVQFQHGVSKNTTAKRQSGIWDTFDTTPQDLNRRSIADWAHYSATRAVSLSEELYNIGDEQLYNLIAEETRDCISSLVDLIVQDIIAGTDNSPDAVTGLDQLIGSNDTVQSLPGSSHDAWNSRGISTKGTAAASISFAGGSFPAAGIANWRKAWTNAKEGMIVPDVLVTTEDLLNAYEGQIVPQERYAAPAVTGNAGFQNLAFKTAPVFSDPFATSGVTYLLNFDRGAYAKFLEGADFDFQPWIHAEEQESRASELVAKLQVCSEDRRFINKVTGQTLS